MTSTSDHPPFDRLVDLVEGCLSPDVRTEVQGHVAACSRCAAEIAWVEHVISLMRTNDAVAPPAEVIAKAKRLFRAPAAASNRISIADLKIGE